MFYFKVLLNYLCSDPEGIQMSASLLWTPFPTLKGPVHTSYSPGVLRNVETFWVGGTSHLRWKKRVQEIMLSDLLYSEVLIHCWIVDLYYILHRNPISLPVYKERRNTGSSKPLDFTKITLVTIQVHLHLKKKLKSLLLFWLLPVQGCYSIVICMYDLAQAFP